MPAPPPFQSREGRAQLQGWMFHLSGIVECIPREVGIGARRPCLPAPERTVDQIPAAANEEATRCHRSAHRLGGHYALERCFYPCYSSETAQQPEPDCGCRLNDIGWGVSQSQAHCYFDRAAGLRESCPLRRQLWSADRLTRLESSRRSLRRLGCKDRLAHQR